jgi:hypothetical protein
VVETMGRCSQVEGGDAKQNPGGERPGRVG